MALDTGLGWVSGDDIRVLIAIGLPVGPYTTSQIQNDLNIIGASSATLVTAIRGLLTQYEAAQTALSTLNASSKGKTLVKADVLEWEAGLPGQTYGPEREMQRIRGLLMQYLGSSVLVAGLSSSDGYCGNVYIDRG